MFPDMMKNESSKFCKEVEDPDEFTGTIPFKKVIARAAQEKMKKQSTLFQSIIEPKKDEQSGARSQGVIDDQAAIADLEDLLGSDLSGSLSSNSENDFKFLDSKKIELNQPNSAIKPNVNRKLIKKDPFMDSKSVSSDSSDDELNRLSNALKQKLSNNSMTDTANTANSSGMECKNITNPSGKTPTMISEQKHL